MGVDEAAREQLENLGAFIRRQRTQAEYSLRELAERAQVSNPYLSQIERGLHAPSVRVLKAIASALNLSAETLLVQAGLLDPDDVPEPRTTTEAAIRADPDLTRDQQETLLAVYRSLVAEHGDR